MEFNQINLANELPSSAFNQPKPTKKYVLIAMGIIALLAIVFGANFTNFFKGALIPFLTDKESQIELTYFPLVEPKVEVPFTQIDNLKFSQFINNNGSSVYFGQKYADYRDVNLGIFESALQNELELDPAIPHKFEVKAINLAENTTQEVLALVVDSQKYDAIFADGFKTNPNNCTKVGSDFDCLQYIEKLAESVDVVRFFSLDQDNPKHELLIPRFLTETLNTQSEATNDNLAFFSNYQKNTDFTKPRKLIIFNSQDNLITNYLATRLRTTDNSFSLNFCPAKIQPDTQSLEQEYSIINIRTESDLVLSDFGPTKIPINEEPLKLTLERPQHLLLLDGNLVIQMDNTSDFSLKINGIIQNFDQSQQINLVFNKETTQIELEITATENSISTSNLALKFVPAIILNTSNTNETNQTNQTSVPIENVTTDNTVIPNPVQTIDLTTPAIIDTPLQIKTETNSLTDSSKTILEVPLTKSLETTVSPQIELNQTLSQEKIIESKPVEDEITNVQLQQVSNNLTQLTNNQITRQLFDGAIADSTKTSSVTFMSQENSNIVFSTPTNTNYSKDSFGVYQIKLSANPGRSVFVTVSSPTASDLELISGFNQNSTTNNLEPIPFDSNLFEFNPDNFNTPITVYYKINNSGQESKNEKFTINHSVEYGFTNTEEDITDLLKYLISNTNQQMSSNPGYLSANVLSFKFKQGTSPLVDSTPISVTKTLNHLLNFSVDKFSFNSETSSTELQSEPITFKDHSDKFFEEGVGLVYKNILENPKACLASEEFQQKQKALELLLTNYSKFALNIDNASLYTKVLPKYTESNYINQFDSNGNLKPTVYNTFVKAYLQDIYLNQYVFEKHQYFLDVPNHESYRRLESPTSLQKIEISRVNSFFISLNINIAQEIINTNNLNLFNEDLQKLTKILPFELINTAKNAGSALKGFYNVNTDKELIEKLDQDLKLFLEKTVDISELSSPQKQFLSKKIDQYHESLITKFAKTIKADNGHTLFNASQTKQDLNLILNALESEIANYILVNSYCQGSTGTTTPEQKTANLASIIKDNLYENLGLTEEDGVKVSILLASESLQLDTNSLNELKISKNTNMPRIEYVGLANALNYQSFSRLFIAADALFTGNLASNQNLSSIGAIVEGEISSDIFTTQAKNSFSDSYLLTNTLKFLQLTNLQALSYVNTKLVNDYISLNSNYPMQKSILATFTKLADANDLSMSMFSTFNNSDSKEGTYAYIAFDSQFATKNSCTAEDNAADSNISTIQVYLIPYKLFTSEPPTKPLQPPAPAPAATPTPATAAPAAAEPQTAPKQNNKNIEAPQKRNTPPVRGTASFGSLESCKKNFSDFDSYSTTQQQNACDLFAKNIFLGKPDPRNPGRFLMALNDTTNRAEGFTILARVMGEPSTQVKPQFLLRFTDLRTALASPADKAWYLGPLSTLAEKGLARGYVDSTIRPLITMSQPELAKVIAELVITQNAKPFKNDDSKNPWFTDTVNLYKTLNFSVQNIPATRGFLVDIVALSQKNSN